VKPICWTHHALQNLIDREIERTEADKTNSFFIYAIVNTAVLPSTSLALRSGRTGRLFRGANPFVLSLSKHARPMAQLMNGDLVQDLADR